MTPGLKLTILASSALAVTLNLIQLTANAASEPKDAFTTLNIPVAETPRPVTAKAAAVASPTPTPVAEVPATPTPIPATPAPTPDPTIAGAAAKLNAAGLSSTFARNYLDVQAKTGTPWQLLAAVHRIETHQSGDTNRTSYAGATGPMQFMPATFAYYGRDGDGDGAANISDVDDAIMSAGNYLRANGAAAGNYSNALYHYNHSNTYVANVLAIARQLGL